jgi:AcrR family transcriptional regulator
MTGKDQATRRRILQATSTLLQENQDAEAITVRQIADRAGVGIGLINYHFKTRDALVNDAIGLLMAEAADPFLSLPPDTDQDPVAALKAVFKETGRVGMQFKLARFTVQYALLQGNMEVQVLVLPLLRQIYGTRKSELELRLIAFAMVSTLQVAFIRADSLRMYAGVDIRNDQQRDHTVDLLVDQFLPKE